MYLSYHRRHVHHHHNHHNVTFAQHFNAMNSNQTKTESRDKALGAYIKNHHYCTQLHNAMQVEGKYWMYLNNNIIKYPSSTSFSDCFEFYYFLSVLLRDDEKFLAPEVSST
jgi:hypothetical protein